MRRASQASALSGVCGVRLLCEMTALGPMRRGATAGADVAIGMGCVVAAVWEVPGEADGFARGFDDDGLASALRIGWCTVPQGETGAFGEPVAVAAQTDDAGGKGRRACVGAKILVCSLARGRNFEEAISRGSAR